MRATPRWLPALAILLALFAMASAGGAWAQGDAGEQVYLRIELENVQITSYQLGVLDNAIGRALRRAGIRYSAADLSAASRDAAAGLAAKLGRRVGNAEYVVCVPRGSKQNCIRIVCRSCTAK
jgi:hypothetical protein